MHCTDKDDKMVALQRKTCLVCVLLIMAWGMQGCSQKNSHAPELPTHPGAAWNTGSKDPVITDNEITREGFVYESAVPPSKPLEELPRLQNEQDRADARARLRNSGRNNASLKQSKAHVGDLSRQLSDMLKERPQKLSY